MGWGSNIETVTDEFDKKEKFFFPYIWKETTEPGNPRKMHVSTSLLIHHIATISVIYISETNIPQ